MPLQLSPKQEKRLNDIINVMEKGPLGIAKMIFDLQSEMDQREEALRSEMERIRQGTVPNINDILTQVKGTPGYTPVKGKDYLDGEPGKDGDNYVITEKDLEHIAELVKVPVVDKIIERTEVIHNQPIIKTEIIKEIKEISNETGESIVSKINDLEIDPDLQIDSEHIKGLKETLSKLSKLNPQGGVAGIKGITAGSNVTIDNANFGYPVISATGGTSILTASSGTVNGNNATFVYATAPVLISVDQGRLMQKTSSDGTVNWTGKTTVFLTIAPIFDLIALG